MRIVRIGFIVAVLACAAGAAAQDYIFTNFNGYRDMGPLPAPECTVNGPAQPVVYDRSIWLFYTCTNGEVIPRRYFHPNDRTVVAQPVIIVTPEAPQPPPCPGGMVRGQGGGCVPPNHPLAAR